MKVLDLFAGIGGFTLGLERAGFETAAFCEIEPYAQKVLAKNWPGVKIYDDVRTITADRLISDGIRVDVITGGFPCQDISVAGQQAGIEGERSGLWTECARLIGELRPRYAIFENVTNLLNGERGAWFKRVLWDISSLGYDAEWHCIPASELGAHHHRDRVWIICYPRGEVLLEDSRYGKWRDSQSTARRQDSQRERERDTSAIERPSEDVADTYCSDNPCLDGSASERSDQITPEGAEHLRCRSSKQDVADSNSSRQQQSNEAVAGRPPEQSNGACIQSRQENVPNADQSRLQRWLQDGIAYQAGWEVEGDGRATERGDRWERYRDGYWASEPDVGRVVDGVPNRSHRLKCLGNAVVPPIPELIGRAIMQQNELQEYQNTLK